MENYLVIIKYNKTKCQNKNIPFKVGLKYLWNLFEKQNRKCAFNWRIVDNGWISLQIQ